MSESKRKILLLTCAGRSERFPNYDHGKWAITHPSGNLMGAEALRGMVLDEWEIIVAVNLADHHRFSPEKIEAEFNRALGRRVQIVCVGHTPHRIATVKTALWDGSAPVLAPDEDAFLGVRDCDNYLAFELPPRPQNAIVVCDLFAFGRLDPAARAYADVHEGYVIAPLDEKRTVHRHFVAGAYFLSSALALRERCALQTDARSMTEVMPAGCRAIPASAYEDWGTEADWRRFKSTWKTLFVDLDGTLFERAHRTFGTETQGHNAPLTKNIEYLRQLYRTGRYAVVITTSRAPELRALTETQLAKHGVPCDHLIMGLPACGRVIVNDVERGRGERTAEAIHIDRGAGTLERELRLAGLVP